MRPFTYLIFSVVVFVALARADDCDEVYKIAIQKAEVKSDYELKTRSKDYFESDKFRQDFKSGKFSGGVSFGRFNLNVGSSDDEINKFQEQIRHESVTALDSSVTLYYVDREYGLGLLQEYNECIGSHSPVHLDLTYNPGATHGNVSVRSTVGEAKIKSVDESGLTLTAGPGSKPAIRPGVTVNSAGISCGFDTVPSSQPGYILVQTTLGTASKFLPSAPKPTPTPTPPNTGPLRTKRVLVKANKEGWTDSGVSLNENEQARITVNPARATWTVRGNKPSDYHGFSWYADDRYLVRGVPGCGLAVWLGDSKRAVGFPGDNDFVIDRSPGKILLACDEILRGNVKTFIFSKRPQDEGYKDNKGEIEAIIEVFPLEKPQGN